MNRLKDGPPRAEETQAEVRKAAFQGTQLALLVLAGVYLGYRLDRRWDTSPWMLLAGAGLGLALGLYEFLIPYFGKKN